METTGRECGGSRRDVGRGTEEGRCVWVFELPVGVTTENAALHFSWCQERLQFGEPCTV